MSTMGVAKYASVSAAKGATKGAGLARRGARAARIQAIHSDQAMTPTATQSTTWSVASPKRSVANAPKQKTFCQGAARCPRSSGPGTCRVPHVLAAVDLDAVDAADRGAAGARAPRAEDRAARAARRATGRRRHAPGELERERRCGEAEDEHREHVRERAEQAEGAHREERDDARAHAPRARSKTSAHAAIAVAST